MSDKKTMRESLGNIAHEFRGIYKLIFGFTAVIYHALAKRDESLDFSIHDAEMLRFSEGLKHIEENELIVAFKDLITYIEDPYIKAIAESTLAEVAYRVQNGEQVLDALHGTFITTLTFMQRRVGNHVVEEAINAFNFFVTQNSRADLCIQPGTFMSEA